MRRSRPDDLADIARARPSSARAAGGDPYIGRLMAQQALRERGRRRVWRRSTELADDASSSRRR